MRRDPVVALITFFFAICILGLMQGPKIWEFPRARKWEKPSERGAKSARTRTCGNVARKEFEEGYRLKEAGQYVEAESLLASVLRQQESVLGGMHPDVACCLEELGAVHHQLGNDAHAEQLLKRALAISEAAPSEHQLNVARSLNKLAALYRAQGYYTRAEPLYARALSIVEKVRLEDFGAIGNVLARSKLSELVASLRKNLASLYRDMGHYEQAEQVYLSELQRWNGLDAASLNDLASLYRDLEQYERAERLYVRAIENKESIRGKNHPDVADLLSNLASLYVVMGRYERAEPLYERALSIREAAHSSFRTDVATSLNDLANLYKGMGRYERAEPLYERALSIRETVLGSQHVDVSASLNDIAQLHLAQQHLDEALPLLTRALTLSEKRVRQEVFSFSEGRLASILKHLHVDEERLYSLARAHPDNPHVQRLALSTALLRKGRSVEELAKVSRTINVSRIIPGGLGQPAHLMFERLRALRTQLSMLSLASPGQLLPADYQQRLKYLADEGDALEADIARRFASAYSFRLPPLPAEILENVANALPSDGALIEFIAYHDSPAVSAPSTPASASPSQLRYLAFLLFADGLTLSIDLGPAAPIDVAARRLHNALASRSASYQPTAQELYELTLGRLVPLLGKARRLFVAPDGQLALVSFAALYDGHHFLIDDFDIIYLNSGKDILSPHEAILLPWPSVVVLANPDFSSTPASSSTQARSPLSGRSAPLDRFLSTPRSNLPDQPWPPLPGTLKEAKVIRRLFPEAELLLGPSATKDALMKLPTPGLLHIATHGFFLEDDSTPPASRAVKHFGVLAGTGPSRLPSDPLLRSGLVLADAHAPAAQPGALRREDYLVTALELAGLNLWGTQLVVLSACDTGRGDVKPGQGVYGLRRALMVAGTETLVTSLWKVNDETTYQLMNGYYRNLLAGQGRITALLEAMRTLRKKQPHPHDWAPFIGIGQDSPLTGLPRRSATSPTH